MVTLQGEKKRWNGSKPWCLTDLVSSFNSCAPCSWSSLCVFPCFLSSSGGLRWDLMFCYDILWSSPFEMNQWPFILPVLSQLASRVGLLAMASWAFFPSGFLPRQPEGLNRLHSPPEWICSPWRVNMCFCLFLAFSTRHGELENLGGEQLWPSTLTFAFLHVFLAS